MVNCDARGCGSTVSLRTALTVGAVAKMLVDLVENELRHRRCVSISNKVTLYFAHLFALMRLAPEERKIWDWISAYSHEGRSRCVSESVVIPGSACARVCRRCNSRDAQCPCWPGRTVPLVNSMPRLSSRLSVVRPMPFTNRTIKLRQPLQHNSVTHQEMDLYESFRHPHQRILQVGFRGGKGQTDITFCAKC